MTSVCFIGEFLGYPAPGKLTVCDYGLIPFHDDMDFESYEIMGRPRRARWVPTRVNYAQKYQLLGEVLGILRREAGTALQEILLNSRMPSWHRMPSQMLGSDIFVVQDLEYEIGRLNAAGLSFISLYEGLVRHANEDGENEILLEWHQSPEDGLTRLQAMQTAFAALGIAGQVYDGGVQQHLSLHQQQAAQQAQI